MKEFYVLIDQAPEESAANAPHAVRDTYMKWLNDRTIVRCVMRTTMNDELSRKFEDVQLEEIIQILNESFSIPEDTERHKTSYAVFNARI